MLRLDEWMASYETKQRVGTCRRRAPIGGYWPQTRDIDWCSELAWKDGQRFAAWTDLPARVGEGGKP